MESVQPKQRSRIHTFDIDSYLNPFIPRPRLHYLPRPISHFFGYRPPLQDSTSTKPPARQTSVLYVWVGAFLGGFLGIALISNVYRALPQLGGHDVPVIIASFGAAAILEYNTVESPLAQPRNLVHGHLICTVIGVSITKLFRHLPPNRFEDLRWLAGALSVGTASAVMSMTKTVHPPAGATALIAATSSEITELGWWLLALIVLGSALMLASALVVNNLYKRFPLYWWTPVDLSKLHRELHQNDFVPASEAEKANGTSSDDGSDELAPTKFTSESAYHDNTQHDTFPRHSSGSELTVTTSNAPSHPSHHISSPNASNIPTSTTAPRSITTSTPSSQHHHKHHHPRSISISSQHQHQHEIRIQTDRIIIPDWISLSEWEREVLEGFRDKIRVRRHPHGHGHGHSQDQEHGYEEEVAKR